MVEDFLSLSLSLSLSLFLLFFFLSFLFFQTKKNSNVVMALVEERFQHFWLARLLSGSPHPLLSMSASWKDTAQRQGEKGRNLWVEEFHQRTGSFAHPSSFLPSPSDTPAPPFLPHSKQTCSQVFLSFSLPLHPATPPPATSLSHD